MNIWNGKNSKMPKVVNKAFIPPLGVEIVYRNGIMELVKAMVADYRSIFAIYKDKKEQVALDADGTWLTTEVQQRLDKLGKKWEQRFKEYAEKKSPQMISKVLKATDLQLKSILKDYFASERFELLGMPTELKQVVKAHAAENISLIKSIAPQYLERVQGALVRAITGGGSLSQLEREIDKYKREGMRRAKLIAHDQIHKVFNTMVARRCVQLGIKRMQWFHSHAGKEPRPYHIRKWDGVSGLKDGHPNGLNGFIFELAHLPVIQEKQGKQLELRGLPSQLVNCRCFMKPVIE